MLELLGCVVEPLEAEMLEMLELLGLLGLFEFVVQLH